MKPLDKFFVLSGVVSLISPIARQDLLGIFLGALFLTISLDLVMRHQAHSWMIREIQDGRVTQVMIVEFHRKRWWHR